MRVFFPLHPGLGTLNCLTIEIADQDVRRIARIQKWEIEQIERDYSCATVRWWGAPIEAAPGGAVCGDCKGTRLYVGLLVVEPCPTCCPKEVSG